MKNGIKTFFLNVNKYLNRIFEGSNIQ